MKTFPVIINKEANGISLKSPSGKVINVTDTQIENGSMGQILLYNKLVRITGVKELTTEEMQRMLDASKLEEPKLKGTRSFSFKKFGRYFSFDIKTNGKSHEDNYIASMERKGYKHIGTQNS